MSGGGSSDALARALASNAGPVVIRGAGTRRVREVEGAQAALALDTRGLTRVLEYQPAEMVITVEAGCTWDEVDRLLAAQGQRLGVRPPLPEGATLGGLVAADAVGWGRHRDGGWRDQVLGLVALLADGTRVTSGGRVVKNVAGYDLAKVLVGSFGAVALVTELSLRVHPRPQAACVGELRTAGANALGAALAAVRALPVDPQVLQVESGGGLVVGLEGREVYVAEHRAALMRAVPGAWAWTSAPGAMAAREDACLARLRAASGARVVASYPSPSDALHALTALGARASEAAWLGARADPGTGLVELDLAGVVEARAPLARWLADDAVGHGGAWSVPEGEAGVAPFGAEPPGLDLMRRVRQAFDPGRRFCSPLPWC